VGRTGWGQELRYLLLLDPRLGAGRGCNCVGDDNRHGSTIVVTLMLAEIDGTGGGCEWHWH